RTLSLTSDFRGQQHAEAARTAGDQIDATIAPGRAVERVPRRAVARAEFRRRFVHALSSLPSVAARSHFERVPREIPQPESCLTSSPSFVPHGADARSCSSGIAAYFYCG